MRRAESPCTWANAVTVLRTVGGLVVFSIAGVRHSAGWNLVGLAVYWLLDVLDGTLARRLNQETRLGAQLDILGDRLLVAFFYLNYARMHPDAIVPVALFLLQFMVIDHYLSNQFMRWPILSPNYFHAVDRTIWRLNWSAPAKVANGALVTVLLLTTGSAWLASAACLAVMAVKVYSCVRLQRLTAPAE